MTASARPKNQWQVDSWRAVTLHQAQKIAARLRKILATSAMFEGLVFDEQGHPAPVKYVGERACYVVDEDSLPTPY